MSAIPFPAAPPGLPAPVGVEVIQPMLRGGARRIDPPEGESQTVVVILASGQLRLGEEGEDLTAPLVQLVQKTSRVQLVFGPGSEGYLLVIPQAASAEIAGRSAEGPALQDLLSSSRLIRPAQDTMAESYMIPAARIEAEVRASRPGSHIAVIAWLRLLLVNLWREAPLDRPEGAGISGEAEVIRAFRTLVELHFRHHLGVADYARLLGVGYDRLHGICRRKLGRSPLQLIHQRLLREAVLRIERTDEPVAAIAWACGFSEPHNFSRFFRRAMGVSPLHHRAGLQTQAQPQAPERGYADWP